jgi:GxxExxY protein
LESVYEAVLAYELKQAGLSVKNQIGVPFIYNEIRLDVGYRMDLLIEDKVVIEVEFVENLSELHHKQLLTYLRLADKRLGILVNFTTDNISTSILER